MKRFAFLIFIAFLIVGCNDKKPEEFVIEGNAEGIYNGIRVYLKEIDNNGKLTPKDTAIIMNERFKFSGKLDYPSIHFLEVDNISGNVPFMLENSEINIIIDNSDIRKTEIVGSKSNLSFIKYQNDLLAMKEKSEKLIIEQKKAIYNSDTTKVDSLTKILANYRNKFENYSFLFIDENPNSYFSLTLLNTEIQKKEMNFEKIDSALKVLSSEIRSSEFGKMLSIKIDSLRKEYEKTAYLEIGKKAPNFEAPTPNGDIISLDKIKGKVTIVDFWAAWCGPCRKENPNVVKIYNEYHDKGLEIIGVSLDGTPRQKDPKKAWTDAIEKDNLTWNHVSNLNYFNDPVAQLYNITAIPATYILDENGTIVAKNLRGRALERKIKELIEK